MGAAQLPDCPHLCLYVAPNNILAKPCTLYKEGQPLPSLGLLLLYYYSSHFQNMNLELSTQEQHLALRTCTHVLRYPSTHVHCTLYPRVQPHVPGLVTYFFNVADIQYIVDHFPVLFSYLRWTLTSQYSLPTQSRWFPPQWNLLGVRVCREKLHQGQTTLWLGLTSFHPIDAVSNMDLAGSDHSSCTRCSSCCCQQRPLLLPPPHKWGKFGSEWSRPESRRRRQGQVISCFVLLDERVIKWLSFQAPAGWACSLYDLWGLPPSTLPPPGHV